MTLTFIHKRITVTAGKIPPSVNDVLLFTEVMSLNHDEYKIINVIRNDNDKISVVLR